MTGAEVYLIYLLAGIAAGLLSGLFGLGGGLTIVPALAVALPLQGVAQEHVMHLAIGTSLCGDVLHRGVHDLPAESARRPRLAAVLAHAAAVALGTAVGAFTGGLLPGPVLRAFFIAFVAYMIVRTLRRHFATMKTVR